MPMRASTIGAGMAVAMWTAALAAAETDFTTLRHVRTLGDPSFRHAGDVTCVRTLPDGRRVLSAARDGTVRLWDAAARREIRRFPVTADADIWDVLPRRDHAEILAATGAGDVVRWDLESGRELSRHKHPGTVFRLAEFPDAASFVATDTKGGALRWAWDGAAPLQSYSIPKDSVYAVAVSQDGRVLVTGGEDLKGPQWWDAAAGGKRGNLAGVTGSVHTLALSPDGKALAACVGRDLVRLDPASGAVAWTHTFAEAVHICAWSPDGARLAVPSDGTIFLVDSATGQPGEPIAVSPKASWGVAWSPDGATVYCGARNTLAVVDVAARRQVFPPPGSADPGEVTSMAATADGKRLWLGTGAAMVPVDGETGAPGERVALQDDNCRVAAAGGGRFVVAAEAYGTDKPYFVFEAATGRKVAELPIDGSYVQPAVAGDASGSNVFVVAGDHVIREYAVPAFTESREWRLERTPSERGAAANRRPADLDMDLVDMHTAADGSDLPDIESVAVSPDGRHLAVGCRKGVVALWDRTTGRRWPDLRVGDDAVNRCAVTDGATPVLVVAGERAILALPLGGGGGADDEAVRARIAQLGADTHAGREAATRELAAMGEALRPYLRKWTWDDPEIVERLRKIEKGMDGVLAEAAPAVEMAAGGPVGALIAIPGTDVWAAACGTGANAEILFCALRDGSIRVLHRLRTGRGPSVLQWMAVGRGLWVGNLDGTVDRFELP